MVFKYRVVNDLDLNRINLDRTYRSKYLVSSGHFIHRDG